MKYDSTSLKLPIENLEAEDYLPLNGTDYIEFYVGNAKQSAHFFKTAFGFQDHAYSGLETGSKEKTSYVLKQNKIILVLTSSLTNQNNINDHLTKHGDGVKNIAIWVDDSRKSWKETTKEEQAKPSKIDPKYIGKKMSRNEPCFCGSGKKFKKCCGSL